MDPILYEIPEKFETERLIISIAEHGDGEEMLHLLQNNFEHLQEEIFETRALKTVEEAEAFYRGKRIEWLSRQRFVPKIVEKTSGRIIGQLWIEPKWEEMIFEIGYFLVEASVGKGYITEAVQRMMDYLFNELKASKLEIHTKVTNQKSIAVAERCGFIREGQLRERSRTNAGEAVDLLVFGLLRSEYRTG